MSGVQRPTAGRTSFARKAATLGVVAVVLVGVLVAVRRRPVGQQAAGPEEQLDACVSRMMQAAQAGDVATYLSCFGGELRRKLQARLEREGREQAAAELRASQADLKSYVTMDWNRLSDSEATLTLERVYSDHNEKHRLRLQRSGRAWTIVEMTPLESYAPEIPYGTPVFVPPPQQSPQGRPQPTTSTGQQAGSASKSGTGSTATGQSTQRPSPR